MDGSLAGFQSSSVVVSKLSFKAKGDQQDIQFQGEAKGKMPTPFDFQMRGRGLLSEEVQRLRLEAFKGKFGEYPIALTEPLAFERTGTDFSLERLAMSFGKGRLAASGQVSPKGTQLDARFRELPLGAAALVGGPPLVGSVQGEIDVNGLPSRLQSNARVQIDGLQFPETMTTDIPSIVLAAKTVVSGGSLNLDASMAGLTEVPAHAALKIPVSYSLDTLFFLPHHPRAVSGPSGVGCRPGQTRENCTPGCSKPFGKSVGQPQSRWKTGRPGDSRDHYAAGWLLRKLPDRYGAEKFEPG